MTSTTDPRDARALSLIHDADALGFFDVADPALLAPLARAIAAEAVLGNLTEVAEVAEAHSIPSAGVELLAQAGMIAYFPTVAMVRHIQLTTE